MSGLFYFRNCDVFFFLYLRLSCIVDCGNNEKNGGPWHITSIDLNPAILMLASLEQPSDNRAKAG